MKCDSSKVCGWITALSQLSVALCVLYVGYLANSHMERMVISWERTAHAIERMETDVQSMDRRMWEMNNRMGGIRQKMNPMQMMMPW
jgi:hypothetical protein